MKGRKRGRDTEEDSCLNRCAAGREEGAKDGCGLPENEEYERSVQNRRENASNCMNTAEWAELTLNVRRQALYNRFSSNTAVENCLPDTLAEGGRHSVAPKRRWRV